MLAYYKSANIVSMDVVTEKKTVQTEMLSYVFMELCDVQRADEEQAADCSRLADQRRRTLKYNYNYNNNYNNYSYYYFCFLFKQSIFHRLELL